MVFARFPPPRYDRLATADKPGAVTLNTIAQQLITTYTTVTNEPLLNFGNIPQTYTHLLVCGITQGTATPVDDNLCIRLNDDATANYDWAYAGSQGGVSVNGQVLATADGLLAGNLPAAGTTNPANNFGPFQVLLPNYTNTARYKTALAVAVQLDAAGGSTILTSGSDWRNTAAITTLTFRFRAGNIKTGSQFSIYGLI